MGTINEEKSWRGVRLRAAVCHYCPLCHQARKNPDSRIGKMMLNRHHAENCPMWKAHQEVHRESGDTDQPKVKALRLWKAF